MRQARGDPQYRIESTGDGIGGGSKRRARGARQSSAECHAHEKERGASIGGFSRSKAIRWTSSDSARRSRRLKKSIARPLPLLFHRVVKGCLPPISFTWAVELTRVRPQLQGLEHWEQIEHQMIAPHVNQVMQALSRQLTGTAAEQWEAWRDRYIPQLLTLLRGLRREATERSRARTASVSAAIDPLLPESRRKESLSRKALWVLASTPGVTSVLNGMRSPAYVEDSIGILQWAVHPEVRNLYDRINKVGK